jgi:hypothetical protein
MFLLQAAQIVKEQSNMEYICLFIATTIFWSRFIVWLKEVRNSIMESVNPSQ